MAGDIATLNEIADVIAARIALNLGAALGTQERYQAMLGELRASVESHFLALPGDWDTIVLKYLPPLSPRKE